ncbi:Lysophospholipase L1 [Chitinophaga jiangningensis]|uniref:Lysophospholipase L1 n=1 Tax=Chitinophaga jiangningensis TaxID=1419482 RepID=A0A1M6YWK1_9BACT|nr:rhamnogalacturonan acetylesterase [Chitinophaga jiangningensis]SHL22671.1 Lysophospholipase L1 [Chitinophaga jiangningensis]
MKTLKYLSLAAMCLIMSAFVQLKKPVLYIIGDSTVKNGDGKGTTGQWGWGTMVGSYFDTAKIDVQNHAIGGRSSRTFLTEGRWERILADLKPGDYVIMQFGHNDAGPLDDTSRARGTIRGTGEESKEIYNPIRKQQEVVHTYGWYMRKYVAEAKAKGAIAIICSPVPRDNWNGEKAKRGNADYGLWAHETADTTGAFFIDLNNIIADKYDAMGKEKVAPLFKGDHTHTGKEGAELNAAAVIEGLKKIPGCTLNSYLR